VGIIPDLSAVDIAKEMREGTRPFSFHMDKGLPLPSLLSHALVAFTVEFDNEFEHRVPHRTTNHGSTADPRHAPWLVSMVMWSKFMRFVPNDGIPVRELQRLTRLTPKDMRTWLTRMGAWWGYVAVEPDLSGSCLKRPGAGWVVRPTTGGRKALETWRPLTGVIEERWRRRFGQDEMGHIRASLQALVNQLGGELAECLPILGYGLFSKAADHEEPTRLAGDRAAVSDQALQALLSKVLLAFAIEFERGSKVSLAVSANVLRLVGKDGVLVRDLPRLAAVSKEAIAMSVSFLEKHGYAVVKPESPCSRAKVLVLTAKGNQAQDAYHERVWAIEERWQASFGKETVRALRESLERLVGEPTAQRSPLFRGLEPYPDGWRASVPRPEGLPHYPMILHRGGFPDGS
jgi:DNA-binding MarR family transcriptional regulator